MSDSDNTLQPSQFYSPSTTEQSSTTAREPSTTARGTSYPSKGIAGKMKKKRDSCVMMDGESSVPVSEGDIVVAIISDSVSGDETSHTTGLTPSTAAAATLKSELFGESDSDDCIILSSSCSSGEEDIMNMSFEEALKGVESTRAKVKGSKVKMEKELKRGREGGRKESGSKVMKTKERKAVTVKREVKEVTVKREVKEMKEVKVKREGAAGGEGRVAVNRPQTRRRLSSGEGVVGQASANPLHFLLGPQPLVSLTAVSRGRQTPSLKPLAGHHSTPSLKPLTGHHSTPSPQASSWSPQHTLPQASNWSPQHTLPQASSWSPQHTLPQASSWSPQEGWSHTSYPCIIIICYSQTSHLHHLQEDRAHPHRYTYQSHDCHMIH